MYFIFKLLSRTSQRIHGMSLLKERRLVSCHIQTMQILNCFCFRPVPFLPYYTFLNLLISLLIWFTCFQKLPITLTRCWLLSFPGGSFGRKINSKGRRAYSREIWSEKASEFSQAGFVSYLFLYMHSSLHVQKCMYQIILSLPHLY